MQLAIVLLCLNLPVNALRLQRTLDAGTTNSSVNSAPYIKSDRVKDYADILSCSKFLPQAMLGRSDITSGGLDEGLLHGHFGKMMSEKVQLGHRDTNTVPKLFFKDSGLITEIYRLTGSASMHIFILCGKCERMLPVRLAYEAHNINYHAVNRCLGVTGSIHQKKLAAHQVAITHAKAGAWGLAMVLEEDAVFDIHMNSDPDLLQSFSASADMLYNNPYQVATIRMAWTTYRGARGHVDADNAGTCRLECKCTMMYERSCMRFPPSPEKPCDIDSSLAYIVASNGYDRITKPCEFLGCAGPVEIDGMLLNSMANFLIHPAIVHHPSWKYESQEEVVEERRYSQLCVQTSY